MSPSDNPFQAALKDLEATLLGQSKNLRLALAALVARGHILLEGPPGVGKTSLAKALSQLLGLDMHRIQMTSDLLPSDLLGFLRPTPDLKDLEFRKGPIFCNLLLTDELNRCPPKTQSALLEAMGEATVSMDGSLYPLPKPFFVVATQNPLESFGTFPLAESELDRFMISLEIERPSPDQEIKIYLQPPVSRNPISTLPPQLLDLATASLEKTTIEKSVFEYFYKILQATRGHPEIKLGASVRAGIHFLQFSKALAYLANRDFLTPTDLIEAAPAVLSHRLVLIHDEASLHEKNKIMESILGQVRSPR